MKASIEDKCKVNIEDYKGVTIEYNTLFYRKEWYKAQVVLHNQVLFEVRAGAMYYAKRDCHAWVDVNLERLAPMFEEVDKLAERLHSEAESSFKDIAVEELPTYSQHNEDVKEDPDQCDATLQAEAEAAVYNPINK